MRKDGRPSNALWPVPTDSVKNRRPLPRPLHFQAGGIVPPAFFMHVFTWQPHGSQFTIIEPVPASATRFRMNRSLGMLEMIHVLGLVRFKPDWIEILE